MEPIVCRPKHQRHVLADIIMLRFIGSATLVASLRELAEYILTDTLADQSYWLAVFSLILSMGMLFQLYFRHARLVHNAFVSIVVPLLFIVCVYNIIRLKISHDANRVPLFYLVIWPVAVAMLAVNGVIFPLKLLTGFVKGILAFWFLCSHFPAQGSAIIVIQSQRDLMLELLPIISGIVLLCVLHLGLATQASRSTYKIAKRSELLQIILNSTDGLVWRCDSSLKVKNRFGKHVNRAPDTEGESLEVALRRVGCVGDTLQLSLDKHKHVIETGQPCEYVVLGKPQSEFQLLQHSWSVKLSPEKDDTGAVRHVVGVAVIVDDLLAAQQKQQHCEQLYKTLVDSISVNVVQMDRDATIIFTNQGRLFEDGPRRLSKEELIGKNFFDLLTCAGDQHTSHLRSIFQQTVENGEATEYDFVAVKGGSVRVASPLPRDSTVDASQFPADAQFFSMRFVPMKANGSQGVEYVIKMTQNVTEKYQAISEQRKAEAAAVACAAKSQFLSTLSHELKNPLQISVGSIELLKQSATPAFADWQKECIQNAVQSQQHLLRILNDVMLSEKVSAGQITIVPESVDVVDFIESVASSMSTAAAAKGLQAFCFVDPRLPRSLLLDPFRLRQVFTNMLGNAIKFTKSGYVCLSAELVQEQTDSVQVRFAVDDTGIGIRQSDWKRVFEPFQQIEDGTRSILPSAYAGFGLGMPLSRKIIELMGGSLDLQSTFGKGSCFFATLSAGKDEQNAARAGDELRSICPRYGSVELQIECQKLAEIVRGYLRETDIVEVSSNADAQIFVEERREESSLKSCLRIKSSDADVTLSLPLRMHKLKQALTLDRPLSPPQNKSPEPGLQCLASPELVGRAKTILICEDVKMIQKLLVQFMKRLGFENIETADDGQQAVELISKAPSGHYGVVFMDLVMPRLNGIQATRAIRQIERATQSPHVPVICLTANDKQQTLQQCNDQVCFSTIVNKPCTLHDIFEALKLVLEIGAGTNG